MQRALKDLKQDDSIIILPADKGRARVLLDTDTYHVDGTFTILDGNNIDF